MNILVTGANGFVGFRLCEMLAKFGHNVIGSTRAKISGRCETDWEVRVVGDISDDINWSPVLRDIDVVVHLAARVHVMKDQESDPLLTFRRVNVKGTEQLLRQVGMREISHFVYVSTVKVHGDLTIGTPFSNSDFPSPSDAYAISKLEAEKIVQEIGADAGFETTVIRPPLVYGPGVGGNFERLLGMVSKGVPLPFAMVRNSRSLVYVDNLCDLIRECLSNPLAAGKQFLVSDGRDVSTPELIRLIASSMSRPARLVPVPPAMLMLGARLLGQAAAMTRLVGSLQVDIRKTTQTLDWRPPVSLAEGIDSTVAWHQESKIDE